MNKLMVIMACLILLLSASAYGTSYLEGYDYWTNPRFSEEGDGHYDAFYGNWGDEALILSTIYGSLYEPMVADLNDDGTFDVVIHDTSGLLKVYNMESRSFVLQDEINTGSAPQAQWAVINSSQGGGPVIVTLSDDIIRQYSFNSSNELTLEATKDLRDDSLNRSSYPGGFICTNRETSQVCLLSISDTLIYYYPDTNATSSAHTGADTIYGLADWDNDGRIEAAIGKFNTYNLTVFDINLESVEKVVTGPASDNVIKSATFYNIDGTGFAEVIGAWGRYIGAGDAENPGIGYMYAYNVAGSSIWSYSQSLTANGRPITTYMSQPVTGSFTSSSREVCIEMRGVETDATANDGSYIKCVTAATGTEVYSRTTTDLFYEPASNLRIYSVDMTGDGYDDILQYMIIDDPQDSVYINHSCNNIYAALSDVDGDGDIDILSSTTSLTEICFSDFSNTPPEFTVRHLGASPFSLDSPICPGTTITFSATECGNEPCHYTNDAETDDERLLSGCGYNSTYWNGSWSLSSPSISCYFPSLGTYPVRVYIQDDSNPSDYNEYQDRTVIIYNGTPGVTCNIAASLEDVQGSNATSAVPSGDLISDDDISQVEADITGQSSFLRWMIVLIVTGMILVALASQGVTSFAVYAISILCLWFAFAGIGMISGAIVFILVIVIIALSIGARVMSPGGGGG